MRDHRGGRRGNAFGLIRSLNRVFQNLFRIAHALSIQSSGMAGNRSCPYVGKWAEIG